MAEKDKKAEKDAKPQTGLNTHGDPVPMPDGACVPSAVQFSTAPSIRDALAAAALTGIVNRHGATDQGAIDFAGRLAYRYADAALACRDVPYVAPRSDAVLADEAWRELNARPAVRRPQPEEWLVYDGGTRHDGFASRDEAEYFASARPGSTVKKKTAALVADPGVGHQLAEPLGARA